MSPYLGIIFALLALVSWGLGDFFIQRSAKKFGDWESLFVISLIGTVLLLPFVFTDLIGLTEFSLKDIILLLAVAVIFIASNFINVEAFRRGKLAVVESISAVEVIIAGILAFIILNEEISSFQVLFISILLLGIFLVALKPHHFRRETWLEKGALLAFLGALMLGASDFMVGLGSRIINPLLTVWVFNFFILLVTFIYLKKNNRFQHFNSDFQNNKKLMIPAGFLDNFGWLCFATSTLFIPIVVSSVLSESYIILATILGLVLNKEKLQPYQFVGIIISIICIIVLSVFYS